MVSLDLKAVDEPPIEQSLTREEPRQIFGRLGRGTMVGCAGLIVGGLILLLFITYVVTWVQKPSLKIVGSIERWLYFVANLVVACYCFPAFRASRQRPFLYLAFAASCFAYGTLFRLFGPRLPAGLPPSTRTLLRCAALRRDCWLSALRHGHRFARTRRTATY